MHIQKGSCTFEHPCTWCTVKNFAFFIFASAVCIAVGIMSFRGTGVPGTRGFEITMGVISIPLFALHAYAAMDCWKILRRHLR